MSDNNTQQPLVGMDLMMKKVNKAMSKFMNDHTDKIIKQINDFEKSKHYSLKCACLPDNNITCQRCKINDEINKFVGEIAFSMDNEQRFLEYFPNG